MRGWLLLATSLHAYYSRVEMQSKHDASRFRAGVDITPPPSSSFATPPRASHRPALASPQHATSSHAPAAHERRRDVTPGAVADQLSGRMCRVLVPAPCFPHAATSFLHVSRAWRCCRGNATLFRSFVRRERGWRVSRAGHSCTVAAFETADSTTARVRHNRRSCSC